MGVWIEINDIVDDIGKYAVTPCVGVWIEIENGTTYTRAQIVTPCVGVWIEIEAYNPFEDDEFSHSLRGSVD